MHSSAAETDRPRHGVAGAGERAEQRRQADPDVIDLNRQAAQQMGGETRLEIIPRATHLFEEPGTLERVARLARDWFLRHLHPIPPGENHR